jgi:hypothetical protein
MEAMMTGSKGTLTDAIRAIWARFEVGCRWAANARHRGDTRRAELAEDFEWRRAEKAFAQLGDAEPPRPPRKPELYLLCGEHPVFVDPTPPANDIACITCDDSGRLVDGRPCQFCCRPTERPSIANDVEEPTAIEGATLHELPVIGPGLDPAIAALEADINRRWALHDGRTGDAFDAALARIDAELARVTARKAVR